MQTKLDDGPGCSAGSWSGIMNSTIPAWLQPKFTGQSRRLLWFASEGPGKAVKSLVVPAAAQCPLLRDTDPHTLPFDSQSRHCRPVGQNRDVLPRAKKTVRIRQRRMLGTLHKCTYDRQRLFDRSSTIHSR